MISLTSSPLFRLQVLQSAGGCLQHAKGLLSLLTVEQAADSSNAAADSPAAGRSISTTRGIYMGRVFIRENLVKSATPSSLYTRDNYQFLEKNRWSLAACEQVLAKHEQSKAARRPRKFANADSHVQPFDPVNRALNDRIRATTNLNELRQVVEEQAHRMTQINLAVVIQKVPQLLFTRKATQDYDAAAVLLDHAANLLMPKLQYLSGPNICSCLASFAKCRYSPSGEMLQQMSNQLLENGANKLQRSNMGFLAQLMLASSRLSQSPGQWPLLKAVLDQTTERLIAVAEDQQQARQRAQQLQQHVDNLQVEAAAGHAVAQPQEQVQQQIGLESFPQNPVEVARLANNIALLAHCFERAQVSSPEYYAAFYKWLANPASLQGISGAAAVQFWGAVRSQYNKHYRLTAAAPDTVSSSDNSNDPAAAVAPAAENADATAAPEGVEEATTSSSADDELARAQIRLTEYFGFGTLDNLAAATAQLMTSMTERELGQVLAAVGAIRYNNPDLMVAAANALENMCKVANPSIPTLVSAAWSAALLQNLKPALLQPLLVAAVTAPQTLDGNSAGRILRLTAWLSPAELQKQQLLLRQELHRRSDARGAPPSEDAAAAQGQNYDWVTAVADDISKRMHELKPREVAHLVSAFSQIPGVVLHEGLFAAAAQHIEAHAHMFTQFREMEMIASAFEAMNYTKGLPALKALQQQTEHMAAQKV